MSKEITRKQVISVAEVLGLDPEWLDEVTITHDEVVVTHIDGDASQRSGAIVRQVVTYDIRADNA